VFCHFTGHNWFVDVPHFMAVPPVGEGLGAWMKEFLLNSMSTRNRYAVCASTVLNPRFLLLDWDGSTRQRILGKPVEMVMMQDESDP